MKKVRKFLTSEALHPVLPDHDIDDVPLVLKNPLLTQVIEDSYRRISMPYSHRELERSGSVAIELDDLSLVVGGSEPHPETGFPKRLFFGAGVEDEPLRVFGTIEGTQAYGVPFVGFIETRSDLRRQGLASVVLPLLNAVTESVYGEALTSGPEYYLSDDGRQLTDKLSRDYQLGINDQGFAEGTAEPRS